MVLARDDDKPGSRAADTSTADGAHDYSHGEGTVEPDRPAGPGREVPAAAAGGGNDDDEVRRRLDPGQLYGGLGEVAGAADDHPGADEDGVG